MGRVILALTALSILTLAAHAHATTVAIVKGPGSSPITVEAQVRLQGELASVGFDTASLAAAAAADADADAPFVRDVMRTKTNLDAAVSVSGEPAPGRVTVWAVDRVRGRSLTRTAALEAGIERSAATLAIRALELLRSCLLELDLGFPGAPASPPPPVAAVNPPPPAAEPVGPVRRVLGAELGGMVVAGLGGAGPAMIPLLRLDWALAPAWMVALEGAGLGTRPSVQSEAGSAAVGRQSLLVVAIRRFHEHGRLRPLVGLAAGALRTTVDGMAIAPNEGRSARRWSLLMEASGGAELALGERFFLVGVARVQLAQPYVAVRLVDEEAATLGPPEALLAVSLGAWL